MTIVTAFVFTSLAAVRGGEQVVAADPPAYPAGYMELDVTVNDIVVDPTRDVIYATVRQDDPSHPNTIATIDPQTGTLLSTTPIAGQPGPLAIVGDGSALYVGLDGPGTLRKLALPDMTPLWSHDFGRYEPCNADIIALDIEVSPDDSDLVVTSTDLNTVYCGLKGVVAIRAGVALPNRTPHGATSTRIEFGATADVLYGYDSEENYSFWELTLDDDGVTRPSSPSLKLDDHWADIDYFDGHVYTGGGVVVDTSTSPATSEGRWGWYQGGAVAVDPENRLAYFSSYSSLFVHDVDTGQIVELWRGPWGLEATNLPHMLRVVSSDVLALANGNGIALLLYLGDLRGSSGEFTAVTPARVLDTRLGVGTGGVVGPLGPGSTLDVQVTGRGGVPIVGADAVVMNVTAVDPTAGTFFTVYPTGIGLPNISNLNTKPYKNRPNLVTVRIGDGGKVTVYNYTGTSHVLVDIAGYYTNEDGPDGSRFRAITPVRIADTRYGTGGIGDTRFGPGETRSIRATGYGGVPVTGPTAVVLNVTVDAASATSFLTVSPADVGRPTASNLNYTAGATVANQVIVRVPADGMIDIYNAFGEATVIVDLAGYYETGGSEQAGRFFAINPYRHIDTRIDPIFPPPGDLGDGYYIWIGWEDDPYSAAALNVTVTGTTIGGYITAYPYPGTPPNTSTVNYGNSDTVANHAIVRCGPDIAFINTRGTTHLIVDVFGVFT